MFSVVVNIIGTLFHFYVAQRLYRIDAVRARVPARAWSLGALLVWLVYLGGVQMGDAATDWRWCPGSTRRTACSS